ncbi:MAG TPA: hypothetical protein VGS80_18215 [Ktedonobacterales bacterium]|nr:hypothetical protein [Ktedonobacterales bacterium]
MAHQWSGAPSGRERATVYDGNKMLTLAGVIWLAFSAIFLLSVCANGVTELRKVWGNLLATLGMSATCFVQARRWARINSRRQAAARGDMILASLAAEQPVPNEAALALPHSITMKPCKLQNALFGLALAGGMLLLLLGYWRVTGDSSGWVLIVIFAGLLVVFGLLAPAFPGSRLTVMSYGLKVHWHGEVVWRDARLFAVRGGGNPSTPATRYELATERGTVEWRRLRRIRWFSLEQPELSFEEYDREMDTLLAVIAAKTGLPLYDLR